MVVTCDVGTATAAGDTTETSIGTITLPSNARRVVGIGVVQGGPGLTSAEGNAGMFRVSCNSLDIAPGKFPVDGGNQLTTGVYQQDIRVWPVSYAPVANAQFTFYVTMDEAQTVANTFRPFIVFEKG